MPCSFVLVSLCVLFEGLLHKFVDFPSTHRLFLDESDAFYYSQASSEDASHFLQKQTCETNRFISELMDIFCAVGTVEQPNYTFKLS
eukprot:1136542-Pelagomonas_calceolata.AAC.2